MTSSDEQSTNLSQRINSSPVSLEPKWERVEGEATIGPPAYYDRDPRRTFCLKVHCPGDEVKMEGAEHLLKSLANISEPMAFEIIGWGDTCQAQVACQSRDTAVVKSAFEGQHPGLWMEKVSDPLRKFYSASKGKGLIFNFHDYYPETPFIVPFVVSRTGFNDEPLTPIYAALSSLGADELGVYQVLLAPARGNWHRYWMEATSAARARLGTAKPELKLLYPLDARGGALEHHRLQEDRLRHYEKQASKKAVSGSPFFAVGIRIGVFGNSYRTQELLKSMDTALSRFYASGRRLSYLTGLDYLYYLPKEHHHYMFLNRVAYRVGFLLNSWELAGFCHLPQPRILDNEDFRINRLPRQIKAPKFEQGTPMGINEYKGRKKEVRLDKQSTHRPHIYIVGPTGAGKSTIMLRQIHDEIQRNDGCIAVIDPKGDLVEDVMALVPRKRIPDVVYFNACDNEYPVAYNILHVSGYMDKERLTEDIMTIMDRLTHTQPMTDRMRRIFGYTLLAILERKGVTLKNALDFLTDPNYRRECLFKVAHERVRRFWEIEATRMGKAGFQASIEGIVDRLDKFVRSERVANLLCCPESRIDFDEIVREKKIFLCNIGRRALGEEMSSVLGKTMYSQLEIAGMSRPRGTKPNLYIYADEFQNYITEGFRITLELGRASNVHLCLTNQHLRDLPDELKGAIFGNVGTVISFNAGHPPDAQTLAGVFGKNHGITADQVVRLPRYHTFVKLDDRVFTMTTLPKPEVDYDHSKEIREYSRKNYCYEPGTDSVPCPAMTSPQVKSWNWMA